MNWSCLQKHLRETLPLVAVSVLFLVTLSYIIHETFEHSSMFHRWGTSQEETEDAHEDFNTFIIVMHLMAASGFVMMVLMVCNILRLMRVNKYTQNIYKKVNQQMRAVETTRDGLSILDKNGIFTYMNKAHAVCYGYDNPEELVGQSWQILYDHERRTKFELEVFPQLYQQGWWFGSSYGYKRDGSAFPQEVSLNLLDDGGLICTVRDVSEKVEKDHLLHIIKLAVEAAHDGVAITDSKNRFIFMNKSFLTIHGLDPNDRDRLLGTDWRDVYNESGQAQINSIVLPTTILKGAWAGTTTVIKKDGAAFYGDASLTRMKDGLILGVMRDISERKLAEKEGEELREKLFHTQKMEAIVRLTSGMAGDFNEFLSVISRNAEIIRNTSSGEMYARAQEILAACGQSSELVEQLQAFANTKNIPVGMIDIKENVAELGRTFENRMPENIDFLCSIKMGDAHIYAHSAKITQILTNVCTNAIDAMKGRKGKLVIAIKDPDHNIMGLQKMMMVEVVPERTVASSVRIRQIRDKFYALTGYLLKGRKYIQVSISDNGMGIAPDILPNIFDPFFTTKTDKSSAGLGLSTVHGLMIGGEAAIVVETVPETGTTIHLFFPRADALDRKAESKLRLAV